MAFAFIYSTVLVIMINWTRYVPINREREIESQNEQEINSDKYCICVREI